MFNWVCGLFKKKPEEKASPRMYLVLREDLAYKYIQGAHALAQYALENPVPFKEWNNQYLICLAVFNGLALKKLADQFNTAHLNSYADGVNNVFSVFIEPDLESRLPTALCYFDDDATPSPFSELTENLKLATK
jgi:hypothetical protein